MSQVWDSGDHSAGDLLVLLAIADFANDKGFAWPSIATLARKSRLSERHVQRIITRLESGHWLDITVNGGPNGSNLYRVVTVSSKEGGDIVSPGGDAHVRGGVTPMSPKPSVQPSLDKCTPPSRKPSLEEVKLYCCKIEISLNDAEWFWNKMEGCGWKNAGKPVVSWERTLIAWKLAGYLPSFKNGHGNLSKPTGVTDKMIQREEYNRIEARLKVIENSYDPHMSMNEKDRQERNRLKTRREELRKLLGILI